MWINGPRYNNAIFERAVGFFKVVNAAEFIHVEVEIVAFAFAFTFVVENVEMFVYVAFAFAIAFAFLAKNVQIDNIAVVEVVGYAVRRAAVDIELADVQSIKVVAGVTHIFIFVEVIIVAVSIESEHVAVHFG